MRAFVDDLAERALRIAETAPPTTTRTEGTASTAGDARAIALIAQGRFDLITKTSRIVTAEAIGSNGDRYKITCDADGWHCQCPGWHHRYRCTHIDAAKLIVAGPGERRLLPDAKDEGRLW